MIYLIVVMDRMVAWTGGGHQKNHMHHRITVQTTSRPYKKIAAFGGKTRTPSKG
jgi:hypothetical protein